MDYIIIIIIIKKTIYLKNGRASFQIFIYIANNVNIFKDDETQFV